MILKITKKFISDIVKKIKKIEKLTLISDFPLV